MRFVCGFRKLIWLSVLPLAIFVGIILLNETLTLHLVLASLVVIGGVAYGLTNSKKNNFF